MGMKGIWSVFAEIIIMSWVKCGMRTLCSVIPPPKVAPPSGFKNVDRSVKVISQKEVDFYSNLVNDHNPIHKPSSYNSPAIVHGTLLQGYVSGFIASSCPDGIIVS